jgi:protein-S-isoprenylcysteine O-methyltransferase Ste14
MIGVGISLVLVPCGLYLLGTHWDWRFGLDRVPEALRTAAAIVAGIVGIVFAAWSNLYLAWVGKGGPTDGLGVAISPRTRRLVTTGPYRYTRNPMVFGALSMYLGLALYLNSPLCVVLVAVLFMFVPFYLRRFEERRLLAEFGEEYEAYRRTTSTIFPLPPRSLRKPSRARK